MDRLHNQVRHWEQGRWWSRKDGATRGDVFFALIQLLATLSEEAEGVPHHPVPREHDMVLPDQLRVIADDLIAAGPPGSVLETAAAAVDEVRFTL